MIMCKVWLLFLVFFLAEVLPSTYITDITKVLSHFGSGALTYEKSYHIQSKFISVSICHHQQETMCYPQCLLTITLMANLESYLSKTLKPNSSLSFLRSSFFSVVVFLLKNTVTSVFILNSHKKIFLSL